MKYDFADKSEGYFTAFSAIIERIKAAVEEFYTVIKGFVDGFKKEFTAEEPWVD